MFLFSFCAVHCVWCCNFSAGLLYSDLFCTLIRLLGHIVGMPRTRAKARGIVKDANDMSLRIDEIGGRLQEQLDQLRNSISGTQDDVMEESVSQAIENFQKLVTNSLNKLRAEVAEIGTKFERQNEWLQRRCNGNFLVFQGVKESRDEDLVSEVSSLISQKIGVDIAVSDLNCSYRLGKKSAAVVDKPRPVAVEFVHRWKRDKVFTEKKELRGSGMAVFELLTSATLNLFRKVKQRLGVKGCWTWKGNVYGLINNSKKRISSEADLN